MLGRRGFGGRARFVAIATAVLGGAFALLGTTSAKPGATDLARAAPNGCVPATNVYVIIYNWKTSASITTYQRREEATNILLSAAAVRRPRTIFGAGQGAATFSPFLAPQLLTPANRTALNRVVQRETFSESQPPATDSVDYNPVFAGAAAADPTASARVFIARSGGGEGPYPTLASAGPPTYVIGFGKSDAPVLRQIAAATGGGFYPVEEGRQLVAQVAEGVNERLSCLRTRAFADSYFYFERRRVRTHRVDIARGTRSVDVSLTWEPSRNRFKPTSFVLVRRGRRLAIRTTRRSGSTFATARISGRALSRGGRLRFQVETRRFPATRGVMTVVGVDTGNAAGAGTSTGPLRPSSGRRSPRGFGR